jgi:fatty acid desaturase
MAYNDDPNLRPERPRYEPEIIPPGQESGYGRRGTSFSGMWYSIEEDENGFRRIQFKRPGTFQIILMVLGAGLVVALFFVVLSALVLLWIPLAIAGVLFALFTGTGRELWQRVQGWLGGSRR